MLISFNQVHSFILANASPINGILHIGAHLCEERYDYNANGINDSNILWIEGNPKLVEKNKNKGVNIFHVLVDEEEKEVTFNITNNGQSSSILQLGTHKITYPDIVVCEKQTHTTMRLDTFFDKNNLDPSKYDFWNLDIQGTELRALKSAGKYLEHVKYIYTEINTEEVYQGCTLLADLDAFLASHGFIRIATKLVNGAGWGDAFYFKQ